jgi:hypothetical protein
MELSNRTQTSIIELVANKHLYTDQELIDAIYLRIESEALHQQIEYLRKENSKIRFELEKKETILNIKDESK